MAGPLDGNIYTQDHGAGIVAGIITLSVLATGTVVLRVLSRRSQALKLQLDDWLIIAALPLEYCLLVLHLVGVYYGGIGKDYDTRRRRLDLGAHRTMYLYIADITFPPIMALIRLSVLQMYYRIFPTPKIKRTRNILGLVAIVYALIVLFLTIFTCIPVAKVIHAHLPGKCIDRVSFFLACSILNVLVDALIVATPIREVWSLNVSRPKKLVVSGIFALGSLVSVIGLIRMSIIVGLITGTMKPDLPSISWVWTVGEPSIGIVSACLPSFGGLVHRRLFAPLFARLVESVRGSAGRGTQPTIITIGGGSSGGSGGQANVTTYTS